MNKPLDRALLWFRRDLRADDHAALYHALRAARQVWCVFVFDRDILDPLPRRDRRVEFIRDSLVGLDAQLRALGSAHGVEGAGLIVRHGRAREAVPALAAQLGVQAVYANHDDDPAALARDARVRGRLADIGVALHTGQGPRGLRAQRAAHRRRQPLQRVHALQERLAEEGRRLLPEGLPGGPPRRRAGAAAAGAEAAAADAGRHRLRAHQPARAEAAQRQRRRPGAAGRLPGRAHRPLPRDARLPRGQGPQLPEHAPALRHGVDPPPGARGLAAHACRAGLARRRRCGCPS